MEENESNRSNTKQLSSSSGTPEQNYSDPYYLMSKMIHDVRLFQVALADLVHILADTSLARQKNLVNQHLTNMLKPTRAVITNYDLAENLQHSIINGTSHVIGLVKTYNAAWEELELKNRSASTSGLTKEGLSAKLSEDSHHSGSSAPSSTSRKGPLNDTSAASSSKDTLIDSAVSAAIAAGPNEHNEFDLTRTPLHEQLFTSIDELALTFSNAVANHLTSLQPQSNSPTNSSSPALLATHNIEVTTTQSQNEIDNSSSNLEDLEDQSTSNHSSGGHTSSHQFSRSAKSQIIRHSSTTSPGPIRRKNYAGQGGSLHVTGGKDRSRLSDRDRVPGTNSNKPGTTEETHVPLSRQPAVRHKSNSYEMNQVGLDPANSSGHGSQAGIASSATKQDRQPSVSSRYTSKSPPLQLQGLDSTESHSIDKILSKNKHGVDKALEHLKYIVKYSNLLIHYIESRTKCLADYGKSLSRNIGKINNDHHNFSISTTSEEDLPNNIYLNLHHHNLDESWIDNQVHKIEEIMSSPDTLSNQPPLYSIFDNMVLNDNAFGMKAIKLREDCNLSILNPLLHIKHETEKNISILSKYWSSERNVYLNALKKYEKSRKNYQFRLQEKLQNWSGFGEFFIFVLIY